MVERAKAALEQAWRGVEKFCVGLYERLFSAKADRRRSAWDESGDLENTQVRRNAVRRVDAAQAGHDLDSTRMFKPLEGSQALPAAPEKRREPVRPETLFVRLRRRQRPFLLAVLFTSIKLAAAAVFLLGCLALGAGLGIARAYVETTPTLDTSLLTKSDLTSYIYDKNGELITSFAGLEYREWADIDEIPDMLVQAVIAIEDVRFYKHDGVDFKRLFSAVVNTLRNADTHGGSTITQQLVKNKLLTSEQTYKRKIQEVYLSSQVEGIMDKDDILEAYLNDVYLGDSSYGMKFAARDYFGKELHQLTLRECAMLAGMIQKPYYTNPRSNLYKRSLTDAYRSALDQARENGYITQAQYIRSLSGNNRMFLTDQRTNTVLYAMYTNGIISKADYDAAMQEAVVVRETPQQQKSAGDMAYFVEYAVKDVVDRLLVQRELLDTNANRTAIENELRTGGYHIYTTLDPAIQNTVQTTLSQWEEYPSLANPAANVTVDASGIETRQPQAAAVIMDQHTGQLRAVVGGRDLPAVKKGWNRVYQSATPVGSSIKPLSVYGPAFDLGLSPGSIILNFEGRIQGYGGRGYPSIGSQDSRGLVSVRKGVTSSLNIVAARVLFDTVGLETSQQYLVNLGIDPSRINVDGPGLALGTSGITPIEMAAAFAAIANGGVYQEPISFTQVLDAQGNVILDATLDQRKSRVFQETTAFLLVDILTDAAKSGTGYRASFSGMTVAGKTGTNADYASVYFAGMTPYYVSTVWVGHDSYAEKLKSGSTGGRHAAPLWKAYMQQIHQGLNNKAILEATPASLGLVKTTVCAVSGLLPTDACRLDTHGTVTDWFPESARPTRTCDMHVACNVCGVSRLQATSGCPAARGSLILVDSQSKLRDIELPLLRQVYPNIVFTDIPVEEYSMLHYEPGGVCPLHQGGMIPADMAAARSEAQALVEQMQWSVQGDERLSGEDKTAVSNLVARLEYALDTLYTAAQLSAETADVRMVYEGILAAYDTVG